MTWALAAALIEKVGIPAAEYIIKKVQAGGDVQPGEWDELEKLADNTPEKKILASAAILGISKDDPRVVNALAMVK